MGYRELGISLKNRFFDLFFTDFQVFSKFFFVLCSTAGDLSFEVLNTSAALSKRFLRTSRTHQSKHQVRGSVLLYFYRLFEIFLIFIFNLLHITYSTSQNCILSATSLSILSRTKKPHFPTTFELPGSVKSSEVYKLDCVPRRCILRCFSYPLTPSTCLQLFPVVFKSLRQLLIPPYFHIILNQPPAGARTNAVGSKRFALRPDSYVIRWTWRVGQLAVGGGSTLPCEQSRSPLKALRAFRELLVNRTVYYIYIL